MSEQARDIANLLLREGSLRRGDSLHADIRRQLMGNNELFEDVRRRLEGVGFELVQSLGHLGVRLARGALSDGALRNRMGLHAGHIRLIVYLWTHLVYREVIDIRRETQSVAPGSEQTVMFEGDTPDQPPFISYAHVASELGESVSESHFKGLLNTLRRWRFIRFDKKRDRIWADASLYTLIDLHRMEDFVVGLAQQLGSEDPAQAVTSIATGSSMPKGDS